MPNIVFCHSPTATGAYSNSKSYFKPSEKLDIKYNHFADGDGRNKL